MTIRFQDFYDFSRQFSFRWTQFGRLTAYNVACLAFETTAVIMLMPIMLYIERRGNTVEMRETSRMVDMLFSSFEWLGANPSFASLLLIAFMSVVFRQIATYGRLIESAKVQELLLRDVRHGLFSRFNTATLEFQERVKIGEFVNTVVVEARHAVLGIMMFVELAVIILMLVVYTGMLVTLSLMLTVLVVVLIALIGFSMRGAMMRAVVESRDVVSSNNDMLAFLSERLSAPRLIRLCGMQQAEVDEFYSFVNRQVDTTVAIRRTTGIGEVVIEPAVVGTGFILIFYAYEYLGMQLATISVFLFVLLRLMPLAKSFITLRQSILAGIGSLEIVNQLLRDLDRQQEKIKGHRRFDGIRESIHFENLSFQYPESSRSALLHINLDLKPGKITALVGHSGSGKSTLIDFLPRLRRPQMGGIKIDGIPLDEYDLESLRTRISFAPQSPQIFDVTIAQHIRYGRPDADDAQIRSAANRAGIADFIATLPNGYQTRLGPGGIQLSGGQKQRLDLARVLASEADMLIFDEPTSNLDSSSEAAFRHALWTLRQTTNATMVVIAHRLRLINWADQIVVLNEGKIEAAGTHAEVFAASPWYRDAYRRETDSDPAVYDGIKKNMTDENQDKPVDPALST